MRRLRRGFAKIISRIRMLIATEGKTPLGKAVEHAVVAGVAVGASLLLTDISSGSLHLSDLEAAGVAALSATLVGLRTVLVNQVSKATKPDKAPETATA